MPLVIFNRKAPFHLGTGLFLSLLPMIYSSCSSLDKSEYDQNFRMQGTYSCEKFSLESAGLKETLAEADVSRVRCARDEWKIMKERVVFTRSFYQSKDCDGILGRVTLSEPLDATSTVLKLKKTHCEVIRKNPSWLAEESGKCMLNHLKLDTPYDPDVLKKCASYLPSFCRSTQSVSIQALKENTAREPYTELKFESSERYSSTCRRYSH